MGGGVPLVVYGGPLAPPRRGGAKGVGLERRKGRKGFVFSPPVPGGAGGGGRGGGGGGGGPGGAAPAGRHGDGGGGGGGAVRRVGDRGGGVGGRAQRRGRDGGVDHPGQGPAADLVAEERGRGARGRG